MTRPNVSTALAEVVIDELAVNGVSVVVVSPGSRSGALAIAAARHPEIDTRVVIDERSAAFHALGVARASGMPAAVIATSGTAPANHFPAIVEADASCVPLVAISADRPAEMRGVGANQTIDQIELFGSKVRAFAPIEATEPGIDANLAWRGVVGDLVRRSRGPRPGPVHLNVAFREPTVPVTDDGRTVGRPYEFDLPRIDRLEPDEPTFAPLPALRPVRGLVIAGDGAYDRDGLLTAASDAGWPVLATALSGLRGGPVVANYRGILGSGVPDELQAETVVAVGAIGPDPVLEDLVAAASNRLRVDRWGRHIDPRRNATNVLCADPVDLVGSIDGTAARSWPELWRRVDDEAGEKRRAMVASAGLTGALVAVTLNDIEWGALVAASSLPIREVDAHLERSGPVFANRGASGIDGFVSMAAGVASVMPGTVAMAGDLSFLHDSNGLLTDSVVDLTIVVVDNHGGGLFDSLPQRRHAPEFERLFVTPPSRDLAALARFHGARAEIVSSVEELRRNVADGVGRAGVDVIIVPVDREKDLDLRCQLAG
jgi:2-succinyl-5-enolpyruvyl-6-hydroxy-3-cyclohexene-1-carboxylate synthase